jgi:hypothetical protein
MGRANNTDEVRNPSKFRIYLWKKAIRISRCGWNNYTKMEDREHKAIDIMQPVEQLSASQKQYPNFREWIN